MEAQQGLGLITFWININVSLEQTLNLHSTG